MNSKIVRKTTPAAKSSKPAAPVRKAAVAAKASQPAPAAEPLAAAPKPKHKLVRDSFTIPKAEYAVLEALKVRAANLARPVKKSELLRAGISALNGMSDKAFLAAMNGVPSLKTGRPSGAEAAAPAVKGGK
ncbi:MAG: hypothetical protein V4569_10800 [Pseudomonadota bacterium]